MCLVFDELVVMSDHESLFYTGKISIIVLFCAIKYVPAIRDQTRLAAWEAFFSLQQTVLFLYISNEKPKHVRCVSNS